ncbi:MAG: transporter substrate-binding domain-containing protein [Bacilli bacterium]|jgi:signal transduction histidine kinase/CheY-like chemotaxis protein/HPt (histidine-containing phosphotransfer) domain-containing protein|nr:transporter substrate-binding domain-containing protein [Bacilli bacterium]
MKKWLLVVALECLCFSPFSTPAPVDAAAISWTAEEQTYIDNHPTLSFGVDPEFVPYEFVEGGEYKGIASDYIKIMEERTGIAFERAPDLSWPEAYAKALNGDVDFLPAISKTDEREEHFSFSSMYYEVRRVIVTRNTNTKIKNIEDLFGQTVAVQAGSSHASFLLEYPEINLIYYDTVPEGLTAVSTGDEIAFVGNLATCDYLIKSSGLTNLRFIAIQSESPVGLHFAVLKSQATLLSIFNKVLGSVTSEERIAINSRWVTVATATDYGPIIEIVIILVALFLVIGGISIFWIHRLKKEVLVRKTAQAELEIAKVQAEEANAVKSTFMARMSHEIRTPLTAITGMAYLLKKSNISMGQRMYADRITQASNTMLTLINDILDYSKMEASKIEIERISFSLDQVIHNLMSIIALKIEEKGLGFRFIKDSDIPVWFFGDPKRLEQALLNLLNNAVKFTSQGEILFEIHQSAKEANTHHLTFIVKDTGIGMAKKTLDQLFTPFTQADSSINRRYGGSGLGLSIVKHLVELMGGAVKAYSTEGEGSTFVVSLSLVADSAKELSERSEGSAEFIKTLRALVIDKNTSNLSMIETYLHSFGVPCELTTSASAAVSLLENANGQLKSPFDLVIVDYDTPEEKGLEFVTKLHSDAGLKRKPKTIILLPMQRTDLFDQLTTHNVDAGIGKPVISSILHNAILEIFVVKAMAAAESGSQEALKPIEKVHRQILVVDDNNTNQLIAKLLLEQSGFDVLTANDGEEAVKLYQQKSTNIDLILMDLHMPVMNGYDAAIKIKTIHPPAVIVAMTAEVTPGVKEKCAQAGMEHYLSKPFEPEVFVAFIRSLLAKIEPKITFEPAPLDVAKGIRQMGDNADLYRLVVREFLNENSDVARKTKEAVDTKNFLEARQYLHKIKGSAGGIGATILSDAILDLHRAIVDNDEEKIPGVLEQFASALDKTLLYIKNNFPEKAK